MWEETYLDTNVSFSLYWSSILQTLNLRIFFKTQAKKTTKDFVTYLHLCNFCNTGKVHEIEKQTPELTLLSVALEWDGIAGILETWRDMLAEVDVSVGDSFLLLLLLIFLAILGTEPRTIIMHDRRVFYCWATSSDLLKYFIFETESLSSWDWPPTWDPPSLASWVARTIVLCHYAQLLIDF